MNLCSYTLHGTLGNCWVDTMICTDFSFCLRTQIHWDWNAFRSIEPSILISNDKLFGWYCSVYVAMFDRILVSFTQMYDIRQVDKLTEVMLPLPAACCLLLFISYIISIAKIVLMEPYDLSVIRLAQIKCKYIDLCLAFGI